jgi:radical SAM protein with 4Fe4S-binding SPASM domain
MSLKNYIYKKVPPSLRPRLAYLNYRVRRPLDSKKNLNMAKCLMQIENEKINYVPYIFLFHITMKCNLRCSTCCYRLESPDNIGGGGYIKVSDFENVINKYASVIEACGLSGGETLLHPELDKLLAITKKNKLPTYIATNGILIKNKIDTLREYPLDTLSVSADGYDYDTFKMFRGGAAKQFDSILEGLSLLRKYDIKFLLSFLLTSQNVGKIGKMLEFASKVKPNKVSFHNINPHGDERYLSLTTNNTKVVRVLDSVVNKTDYPFDIDLPTVFDTDSKYFKSAKCVMPWYHCMIDYKGNIAPCCQLMHNAKYGNMFKGYNFNSDRIKEFRRVLMSEEIMKECLYCQRRFTGEEYGVFDAKSRKWILK